MDAFDGFLACTLHQEPRFGARMEIFSDRLLVVSFYHNAPVHNPHQLRPLLRWSGASGCADSVAA
ncbi:MAG: hypothetical protein ABIR59_12225 [Gemmatimonadales bacterium]